MAKKKDGVAPVASEPVVSGVVNPGAVAEFDAENFGVVSAATEKPTPAERDLNILIEAQRIRRDPARFMAAKALPGAQKHYIV